MSKLNYPITRYSLDTLKTELVTPLPSIVSRKVGVNADNIPINAFLGSLAYRNTVSFSELVSKPTTLSEAGITDKVATLVNGVIPSSQLPSYVDDILEYATLTELQSASIESGARVSGKIYLVTDTGKSYRWSGSTYIDISSKVDSVNGRTGAITITQSDIGLGNVSNTSDLDKPISTATASALNNKVTVVSGKGLSSNDYTDIDKRKLAELPSGWMFGALAFRNTVNYSELKEIPTVFKPDTHNHTIAEVTLLQETLNKKVDTVDGKGLSTNDYTDSDKAKVSSIVPNWMLGALAFRNTVDYNEITGKPAFGSLASKNTITVADISVPTGTASGITYLRGDGSWSSITIPTYNIASGSDNGTISLTSSSGSTTTVSVKGLGTAAYTDSSSYVTASTISGKTDTWMLGALAFRNTINYSELGGTLPTHNHSTTSITDWDKLNAITAKNIYLDTSGAAPYLRGTTDTSSIVIAGGKGWTGNGAIIQLFGNESPVDINSKSTKNGINIFGGGTSALGTQGQCIINNFTKVGINTTSPSEVLSVNGSVVAIGYKTTSGTSAEFLKADGTVDSSSYWTSATASTTTAGIVKLGSDSLQVTSANAVTSESYRTYAVQVDSINKRMVVNVPWVDTNTDTNTTYTFAEGTANGTFNVTPSTTTTPTPVTIHGLGTAAYTNSTAYASSFHSHSGYATISSGSVASSSLLLGDGTMKLLQAPFADISDLSNIRDPYLIRNKCLGGAGEWLSVVANNSSTLELGPVIANTASNSTATNLKLKPNTRINGVSITLKQSDAAMDANYVVQGSDNNLPGWDISLYGNFQKSVGIDNTLKFTAWSVPYYYNATTNKLSNKDSTGNLVTDNWYSGSSNPTFYIHEDGRIALYGNLSAVTGSNPDKSKAFKSQWPPKYGFICITSGAAKITEVPYGANQEYGSLVGAPLYFDSNNKRLYIFDASDTDATHLYGTWYYITATRDTTSTTGNPFSTINSLGKP